MVNPKPKPQNNDLFADVTTLLPSMLSSIRTPPQPSQSLTPGAQLELSKAAARVKAQQLHTSGMAGLLNFVGNEKKLVKKLRRDHRERTKKKEVDYSAVLYEGPAAQYEAPPVVIPIKVATPLPKKIVLERATAKNVEVKTVRQEAKEASKEYYKAKAVEIKEKLKKQR